MKFAIALAGAALALTPAFGAEPTPATPPPAASSAAPAPPNTPGRAVWASTFEEARSLAKQQGKVIFIEFTTKKCGNCFRMDGLLYPAANFEMALLRMVPVKLDLDLAETAKLAKRYRVESVPSILVVSPGGAMIFRMVGFESDRSFYVHLHKSMADWDGLNLLIVHEPETRNDPKSELVIGGELFRRMDSEEAIPRLERAASSPNAPVTIREEAMSYLASAQMDLERFADARVTVEKLLKITKNAEIRERAELFRAQIDLAEGKRDEARRAFQTFLTRHPTSKHHDEAQAYLDRLKQ